jgi:hypothetical protein
MVNIGDVVSLPWIPNDLWVYARVPGRVFLKEDGSDYMYCIWGTDITVVRERAYTAEECYALYHRARRGKKAIRDSVFRLVNKAFIAKLRLIC